MTFVNDLFNSVLQYVLTGAFAVLCAFGGIMLRKKMDRKKSIEENN